MNLSQKVQLLSIVPLMIAMIMVSVVTQYQFEKLSSQTADSFRGSIVDAKKQELKNYIDLALSSISHIYDNDNLRDDAAQELVIQILSDLEYSQDGYFFAYDGVGLNIVHPKQTYRIGQNWWELQDQNGQFIIQDLIAKAEEGGGFVDYVWEKPSSKTLGKKMAYAILLERWGWMLGTGIYIDDVDRDVAIMQQDIDKQINNSSFIILLIALTAFVIVFVTGMLLQMSERKLADEKLQQLTKRILSTQDEERRRVSRELHDGISQLIVSAKFSLETASIKIKEKQNAEPDISLAQERIANTLQDLRRISRDLHPSVLDDHGLSEGLKSLSKHFTERTEIKVSFEDILVRNVLPLDVKTALYRVAQEAFTNIERHASATKVEMALKITGDWVTLSIRDNGKGFNVASFERSKSPMEGIGLRNMHERLAYHKGVFLIKSDAKGTLLEAKIPKAILRFDASKS